MQNQSFFMVYMEGGENPTVRHATQMLAENEAKRLAELHGKKTWVLASIKSFELTKFKETDCRPDDNLPF